MSLAEKSAKVLIRHFINEAAVNNDCEKEEYENLEAFKYFVWMINQMRKQPILYENLRSYALGLIENVIMNNGTRILDSNCIKWFDVDKELFYGQIVHNDEWFSIVKNIIINKNPSDLKHFLDNVDSYEDIKIFGEYDDPFENMPLLKEVTQLIIGLDDIDNKIKREFLEEIVKHYYRGESSENVISYFISNPGVFPIFDLKELTTEMVHFIGYSIGFTHQLIDLIDHPLFTYEFYDDIFYIFDHWGYDFDENLRFLYDKLMEKKVYITHRREMKEMKDGLLEIDPNMDIEPLPQAKKRRK